jgi:hypothetical protein
MCIALCTMRYALSGAGYALCAMLCIRARPMGPMGETRLGPCARCLRLRGHHHATVKIVDCVGLGPGRSGAAQLAGARGRRAARGAPPPAPRGARARQGQPRPRRRRRRGGMTHDMMVMMMAGVMGMGAWRTYRGPTWHMAAAARAQQPVQSARSTKLPKRATPQQSTDPAAPPHTHSYAQNPRPRQHVTMTPRCCLSFVKGELLSSSGSTYAPSLPVTAPTVPPPPSPAPPAPSPPRPRCPCTADSAGLSSLP